MPLPVPVPVPDRRSWRRPDPAGTGAGTGTLSVGVMIMIAGCAGTGLMAGARATAEQAMGCHGHALRVADLGTLVITPAAPRAIDVYQAEGCARETPVFCLDDGSAPCATSLATLLTPAEQRAAERALHLRRTASRARCAPETLRVTQLSESLWRYAACDGRWIYHCRARGCEALARE